MNFLCNLSKFGIIFFYAALLNLVNSISLSAQDHELGLAYIQDITPFSSPDISRYISIVQDPIGFLYVSGNNGLLRFDGSRWQQLNMSGPVKACEGPDGKIIVHGKNYFGTVDNMPDGSMKFNCFHKIENGKDPGNGIITKIWPIHDDIVLLTSTGIFTWTSGKLNPVNTPGLPGSMLCKGDTLIMHIPDKGLYYMYKSTIKPYDQGEGLADLNVIDIIGFDNNLLFYTEEKGLLVLENGKLKDFNPGINKYLAVDDYRNGIYTSNGILIFSTKKGTLVLFDPLKGTTQYYFTEEGLKGTGINSIYESKSGSIWILYDYCLSRIELPLAFSLFDPRNGLTGTINDITRFEGHLYISTSEGIFVLEIKDHPVYGYKNSNFRLIENSGSNCGQLLDCGNILLGISDKGIVKITEDKAIAVYTGIITKMCQMKSDPEIILAGTEHGIGSLNISSPKYPYASVADNFSLSVQDIAVTSDNSLWISTTGEGLFRFPLTEGLADSMTYFRYDTIDGLPDKNNFSIEVQEVANRLVLSTNKGFYYFNESANRFFPYLPLRSDAYIGDDLTITLLSEDREHNLWLKIGRIGSNETEIWKARYCRPDSFDISAFESRWFNDKPIRSLFAEPDGKVWIGAQDILIRYDTKELRSIVKDMRVHIYKIDIGKRDHFIPGSNISWSQQPESLQANIRFSHNNIRFNFISTAFSGKGKGQFQWYLDGFDNSWSEWSDQDYISYEHLSPGTYTFHIRSRDIFGNVSAPDNFRFHISVPILLKWWAILIYSIFLLATAYFLRKWKIYNDLQKRYRLEEIIKERTEALLKEKEKSENLIANILPKNTADELKATGKATSSKFKMVTVLFADIQGFTKIAEQMNPEKLIDELDRFYFQFDSVVEKYNIEKIKTIGDAYMAAGGIPVKNRTNPVEVVLAALQMQQYMKELKKTKADIWDLRIGIHTGSVIAGVVGQKKFSYDIWGDTVNIASRMESSGEIGKVNISATTYELIKDFFRCQYRGKMPVKYKGDIEMYFVSGIKPEFQSENDVTPNEEFEIHLLGLRLLDLEEFIIHRLKNELPETLYFHNAQHTSHVHYQAELLGRSEDVSSGELLLIRTAALCHDLGYIYTVNGHEEKSIELVRQILPQYLYTNAQIEQICKLISATRMPPEPENLMEKILIDANFDHIGRVDFLIESDRLFQEYRTLGKANTKKEWNELQINFLRNFDFFTSTAQKMREVTREQQIENVIKFS